MLSVWLAACYRMIELYKFCCSENYVIYGDKVLPPSVTKK
jgi:hypothetical protein